MTHRNVELIHQWIALMNAGNLDVIRRIYAPDAVVEDVAMGTRCTGHEDIHRLYGEILRGFPDYHVTLHAAFADDSLGGVEFNFSGTHLGDAWGAAPTKRRFDIRGATIMRFSDHLISVQHDYWSLSEYYSQLGLNPPT